MVRKQAPARSRRSTSARVGRQTQRLSATGSGVPSAWLAADNVHGQCRKPPNQQPDTGKANPAGSQEIDQQCDTSHHQGPRRQTTVHGPTRANTTGSLPAAGSAVQSSAKSGAMPPAQPAGNVKQKSQHHSRHKRRSGEIGRGSTALAQRPPRMRILRDAADSAAARATPASKNSVSDGRPAVAAISSRKLCGSAIVLARLRDLVARVIRLEVARTAAKPRMVADHVATSPASTANDTAVTWELP